jgi:hypothetical protein
LKSFYINQISESWLDPSLENYSIDTTIFQKRVLENTVKRSGNSHHSNILDWKYLETIFTNEINIDISTFDEKDPEVTSGLPLMTSFQNKTMNSIEKLVHNSRYL